MRTCRWLIPIVAFAIASHVALAQPVRWLNPAGGDWFTGPNWSSGSVPTQGDDLLFDLDATYETDLLRYGAAAGSIRFTAGNVTLAGVKRLLPLWIAPLTDPMAPALRIGGAGRPTVTMRAEVFAREVVVGEDGPGALIADGLRVDLLRLHAAAGEVTSVDINTISPATDSQTVRGLLTGDGEVELRVGESTAEILHFESSMNESGAASVVLASAQLTGLTASVVRFENTSGNDACSLVVNAPLRVGSMRVIDADVEIGRHGLTCYAAGLSSYLEVQSRTRGRTLRCSGPLFTNSLALDGGRLELDTNQPVIINEGFFASEVVVRRGPSNSGEYSGVRFIAEAGAGDVPFGLGRALSTASIEIYGGQRVYVGQPRPYLESATGENGERYVAGNATITIVRDSLLRADAPDTTPALAAYGDLHVLGDLYVRSDRKIIIRGVVTQSDGYRSSGDHGIYGSVLFAKETAESETSSVQISGLVNAQDLVFGRNVEVDGVGYLSFADMPRINAARLYLFHAAMELQSGAVIRSEQFAVGGYSALSHWPTSLPASALDTSTESTLFGDGEVRGNLYNLGLVRPGADVGVISIRGRYVQQQTNLFGASVGIRKRDRQYPVNPGVLEIDALAPTEPGVTHDLLEITGEALLGGGLRILAPQGSLPRGRYTFLTADTIDGEFESIELPDTGDLPATIVYTADSVSLVVGFRADLTDDGVVNAQDLILFLAMRRQQDPAADFNGDGAVDGQDLAVLLAEWSAPA